jgi:EAL domain-containing protein (putative c-di-GMP-specific phosphodiesterase class I)
MSNPARLLGFCFTNADFLFEMDAQGTIMFTAGAANDLVRESGDVLVGRSAAKLFKPSEDRKFAAFVKLLKGGERAGPYRLTLATGAEANLAMFRLPENGANISCTLARPSARALQSAGVDSATGLASRDSFVAAAEKAGNGDSLTLVNVPGLQDLCSQLSPENAEALMQSIGKSLETSGASATGRISETSFGAVAPATSGHLGLAGKITAAITANGLRAPHIDEAWIGLKGPGLSPEQRILSLRYVVDQFAEKGTINHGADDIAATFTQMMAETQKRLSDMTRKVKKGHFDIAYQPICDLATRKVSHYEALARFSNPQGTGETVKFMEALGIANVFDLAVATKVLDVVEQSDVHVAFNVSGATIASPASFGLLAEILARRRKVASRTLIEITETAAITDLEGAGKAINVLRQMGYRVGLDDFGAGSASINYLHAFQVDFVKFDGAMVVKMGSSTRHDALLSGLVKLCGDLCVTTIAEWIESRDMADRAKAMGFQHGQGKWLGPPALEVPVQVAAGKRRGVTESWG